MISAIPRCIKGYHPRLRVVRWLVEGCHQLWKSAGTRVDVSRVPRRSDIEHMCVILAFIAVWLLQLCVIRSAQRGEKGLSPNGGQWL